MEQEIKDNDILLQQMAKFNFGAPIKAILIIEECDEFDVSLEKGSDYSRPCPASKKNVIKNPEHPIKSTNNICSSNISFDTMENSLLNIESETYSGPYHLPNNINLHNYVAATQRNYIYEPPQNNKTFTNENRVQCSTISNDSGKQYSADRLLEIQKKEILLLLDRVSYNLIEISKFHFKSFLYKSNGSFLTHDNEMARFLNFKDYYFNLSYQIAKSLILPQETNENFIEMYIKRIITLGNKKYGISIPKYYLLSLINDMIKWAKQKKNLESTTDNRNRLQSPQTNKISNNYTTKKNNNDVCLFSCGPENQQLTISVRPEILKNKLNFKNIAGSCDQNLQIRATKRKRSETTDDSCSGANFSEQYNFHENRNRTQATFEHLPDKNTAYTPQATPDINLSYNYPDINYLESDDTNYQNQLAMSRSSVSRDSGFVSPATTTCTGDPMANTPDSIGNHFVATAMSYTDATKTSGYTIFSSCKVCNLQTYKMCIGCYQEYYCSRECQKRDWTRHKFQCRG